MNNLDFKLTKRKSVKVTEQDLVQTDFFDHSNYPMVIRPNVAGLKLDAWAKANQSIVDTWLLEYGALLFRGFEVDSLDDFNNFVTFTSGPALSYQERSSPRETVQEHIYTSTSHPASEEIFLHNEQSYNLCFPLRIYFHCLKSAETGGETTLSDTRRIYQYLPDEVVSKFVRLGYTYSRNFGEGLGLPWQTAFQTTDKSTVEQYCKANDISYEWRSQSRLRTRQIRNCVAIHPQSKEKLWFNHATFFNVSTLAAGLAAELCAQFADDELPNQTFYGDGSAIEPEVLDTLRKAYLQAKMAVKWKPLDVLMVDNIRMSHGREPFSGSRKVVVAMSAMTSWSEVS